MDKVTQSNAAGAEESAASAQELNAQAAAMKESVAELMLLVGNQKPITPAASPLPNPRRHSRANNRLARENTLRSPPLGHRSEGPAVGDFKDF
jgi:methyl-accepting chemotaxis protein